LESAQLRAWLHFGSTLSQLKTGSSNRVRVDPTQTTLLKPETVRVRVMDQIKPDTLLLPLARVSRAIGRGGSKAHDGKEGDDKSARCEGDRGGDNG